MSRKNIITFLRKHTEALIYAFCWLMIFVIPFVMMYLRTRNSTDEPFQWDELTRVWVAEGAFLVIFIIHSCFLAPLIIYKNRRKLYFGLVTVIVIAFGIYQFNTRPPRPRHFHKDRTEMADYRQPRPLLPPGRHRRPFFVDQVDFVSVIILVLMFGMNLSVKLLFKQNENEKKLQRLMNENLNQQLEYLKFQINPHFFMNTLNNIHALVDIDPEEAKESIIELSNLMRYVLYDGNRPLTSLRKECDFIDNYIELMRLRYSDKVDIKTDRDEILPDALIAPLITITYVENAFKHGVSYQHRSFIHITTHVADGRLLFTCENSKHKESTEEHGGVGLANTRKRLDLIYGNDYTLDINDREDTYFVRLDIPLRFAADEPKG